MRRSVVVQHDPARRRLVIGLLVLAAVLLPLGGYFAGGYSSVATIDAAVSELETLRQRQMLAERELDELRQWKMNRETREDVDGNALELVRQRLAEQQALITELEQGIRFYKSLMAPGEVEDGLSIRGIDLVPGLVRDSYQFRVLVQQSARKHDVLTGELRVEIQGQQGGEPMSYELSVLSEQVPKSQIRLKFKYFQAIDGELTLPDGFVPRKMVAYAKSTRPRKVEVRKEFPWSVQEKLTHVGQ